MSTRRRRTLTCPVGSHISATSIVPSSSSPRSMRLTLRSLPGFRRLLRPSHEERRRRAAEESQRRVQQELYLLQLLQTARYADPRHLAHFEAQVFSQNGEDGIINEMLRRIGTTDRFFVEIGAGHGIEANKRSVRKGGRGSGSKRYRDVPRSGHNSPPSWGSGTCGCQSFVSARTRELLRDARVPGVRRLAIDVDRNTSHIWRCDSAFRPACWSSVTRRSCVDEWKCLRRDGCGTYPRTWARLSRSSCGAERGYVPSGASARSNDFFVSADAAAIISRGLEPEACKSRTGFGRVNGGIRGGREVERRTRGSRS